MAFETHVTGRARAVHIQGRCPPAHSLFLGQPILPLVLGFLSFLVKLLQLLPLSLMLSLRRLQSSLCFTQVRLGQSICKAGVPLPTVSSQGNPFSLWYWGFKFSSGFLFLLRLLLSLPSLRSLQSCLRFTQVGLGQSICKAGVPLPTVCFLGNQFSLWYWGFKFSSGFLFLLRLLLSLL